jgi:cell wall-associated NlpC family hydrolase
MLTTEQRQAIIAEAKSWLRTPYHHMGRLKGVGVDCGTLLCEVYEKSGIAPHVEPSFYPPDWHLHRSEERYLSHVEQFFEEVPGPPLPGDLALYHFGRCISHAAIVIDWPMVIHAVAGVGVLEEDASRQEMKIRFRGFWRMRELE